MSATYDVIVIFPIYGLIWEQPGSWIPNAWSVKLTFSLIVSFCLKKLETGVRSGDSGQCALVHHRLFPQDILFKKLFSGTCSRSNVVKSVYSRVSVCITQTHNCTKINFIRYTLLHRVVLNKNYWRRNLNSYPCYTSIIPTMLEEFRLIICLDNPQQIIPLGLGKF